jgi:hypothetical protein
MVSVLLNVTVSFELSKRIRSFSNLGSAKHKVRKLLRFQRYINPLFTIS